MKRDYGTILNAPDQVFSKLTEGIHTSNNTSMINSRGLEDNYSSKNI